MSPRGSGRAGTRAAGVVTALVVSLVVGGLAWPVAPRPPVLDLRLGGGDQAPGGDDALRGRLVDALGGPEGHRAAVVAWVEDGRVATAAVGTTGGRTGRSPRDTTTTTPFEIGSVTKGLTGLLLADAVERGEVRLDQPVGELAGHLEGGLDGGGQLASTGSATLAELATHRSGLPRLVPGAGTAARSVWSGVTGANPYRGTPADVLAAAGAVGAPGGAEQEYSNLGYAVLGDVLAARASTTYPDLLRQRLVEPLGLTGTSAVTEPSQVPRHVNEPVASNGLRQEPWVAEGWAPAGVGVWSTAEDLGALAAALLDGTAPGASALDPLVDDDDGSGRRTGLGWVTSPADPATGVPEITWHNGATGGSTSYVGLDRTGGRAVVVLATGTDPVDRAGVAMLTEAARTSEAGA